LIAEQERLITLLKEKRQAVISHAVTKGLEPTAPMKESGVEWLGEIPAHWRLKRLKEVCAEIVDCKNRTPELCDDGRYFVVRTSCIRDREFDPSGGYYTDEENFVEWTKKGTPAVGDILFTREAPTGEACMAPIGFEFCLGQRMMYFRPDLNATLPEYLLFSIYGPLVRQRIEETSKGSTVGHLRLGEIDNLPVLIPPIAEQRAIVDQVLRSEGALAALSAEAQSVIALSQERRSALISAAVTGKIDVRSLAPTSAEAA